MEKQIGQEYIWVIYTFILKNESTLIYPAVWDAVMHQGDGSLLFVHSAAFCWMYLCLLGLCSSKFINMPATGYENCFMVYLRSWEIALLWKSDKHGSFRRCQHCHCVKYIGNCLHSNSLWNKVKSWWSCQNLRKHVLIFTASQNSGVLIFPYTPAWMFGYCGLGSPILFAV